MGASDLVVKPTGRENIPPGDFRGEPSHLSVTSLDSTNSLEVRKMKVVAVSAGRNRKDKGVVKVNDTEGRPFNKIQIGGSDNIIPDSAEAAGQPRRSQ